MKKILIISANFYSKISKLLLDGAIEEIKKNNYEYEVINVLGALEIPIILSIASKSNKYAGFVVLGCIIRGETSHYDLVANESFRNIMKISIKKNLAIGNGILTTENEEQAIKRGDPKQKNKGGFAVRACLNLIENKEKFNES